MRAAAAFGTAGWIAGDNEWHRRTGLVLAAEVILSSPAPIRRAGGDHLVET